MSAAETDPEERALLKDMGTLASAADRIPVQLGRLISLLQYLASGRQNKRPHYLLGTCIYY